MTKTIEFIDQNIFESKNHIQHLNNKINEYKEYPSFVKSYKEEIENLKPIVQILEQIKSELDVLQILTKCIRVSTISYDDNDVSKTSYDYSLETDELTIEEFNTLDNYYKALEVENG